MKQIFAHLQRIGGALMLPIAVLPVAALLLRFGQPDLLNLPVLGAAGQAIFDNLGLLFAVGVAVGLARENHGAAGLAAVVAYLVTTQGAQVFITPPVALTALSAQARNLAIEAFKQNELKTLTVPAGILCGLLSGVLYNRFHRINLPPYLAFFGGRRFVPILSGVAALALAAAFGLEWQRLEVGMDTLSRAVLAAGPWGLFGYGVLNRILIVTGLHHVINSIAWFVLGNYHGHTGDLNRFFAGDPTAGQFMAGFFPVMMFGLPAACLAMYHTALPDRRRAVAGLLASIALTSFLTGVTEPVEFSFMFLAPALYAVHALLTGFSFIIMKALGVRLGFGFSAGLFDYVQLQIRRQAALAASGRRVVFRALLRCLPLRDRQVRSEDARAGDRRRSNHRSVGGIRRPGPVLHHSPRRRREPRVGHGLHDAPAADSQNAPDGRCRGTEATGCAGHRATLRYRATGGSRARCGSTRRRDQGNHCSIAAGE